MAAGRVKRVIIGTGVTVVTMFGLAVALPANAETITMITEINPNGDMRTATTDAADKCRAGEGTPSTFVSGYYDDDGTAVATIECIYE